MGKKKRARKSPRARRNPAARAKQATGSPHAFEYTGLPDSGCFDEGAIHLESHDIEDLMETTEALMGSADWDQLTWKDVMAFPLSLPVFSVASAIQDTAMPFPIPAPGWEAHPKMLARKVSEGWTATLGGMPEKSTLRLKPYRLGDATLEHFPHPWGATEGVALGEDEALLIPRLPGHLAFFLPGGNREVAVAFHPAYPADEYSVLLMVACSTLVFFVYPSGGDRDPLFSDSALRDVGDALGAAIRNAEGAAFSVALDQGQGLASRLLRERTVRRVEVS